VVSALLGVWLMAAPAVLGYHGPERTSDRIVGPIVAALSIVAASAVMRALRWAVLPAAVWLVLAPWVLGYGGGAKLGSILVGLALAALAPVRGRVAGRFGGGWRALFRSPAGRDLQEEG
jgi:hypothetical protein